MGAELLQNTLHQQLILDDDFPIYPKDALLHAFAKTETQLLKFFLEDKFRKWGR